MPAIYGSSDFASGMLPQTPSQVNEGEQCLILHVQRFMGRALRRCHCSGHAITDDIMPALQPAGKRKSPIHGPNQWPSQLPAFEDALRRYLDTMLQLGSTILQGTL